MTETTVRPVGVTAYPEFSKHPEFTGLFVGGCVERGIGSRFRHQAHAHWAGDHAGWICVLSARRLYTASGDTSQLMRHELAHLIAPGGHHDKWRTAARALGYRLPARYQRKSRAA